jgi:predicted transcriptional regulator
MCIKSGGIGVTVKVFDSELKVMELLWKEGELTAGQLAKTLAEQTGWNRNTTYTVIGKLVDKGAVKRKDPNFLCSPLITKEQVQKNEATELIDKLFDGSAEVFLSAFLGGKILSKDEREDLKDIIEGQDEKGRLRKIIKRLK